VSALLQWTVEMPGFDAVTIWADTGAGAFVEAAELHHLPEVPPGTRARDGRGQEFACSSATS
jgi:hypothetical protein